MGVASGGFMRGGTLVVFFGMLALDGGGAFLVGAGCFTGSVSGSGINAEIVNENLLRP